MIADVIYLVAALCFIFALSGLSSPAGAYRGNCCGIVGIVLAVIGSYISIGNASDILVSLVAILIGGGIGVVLAKKVSMASLPQMVAGFHSLVGLSAVLIAFSVYLAPELFGIFGISGIDRCSLLEIALGASIGAITFSGSMVAFLKLEGLYGKTNIPIYGNAILGAVVLGFGAYFVASGSAIAFIFLALGSFILGGTLIAPVGGADMPVVVSMLNSYSGWAASGIGFTMQNDLLIITGALVGASGAILSYIMCKGMNRSLFKVIFAYDQSSGGCCSEGNCSAAASQKAKDYHGGSAEDVAFILKNSRSVIIVPGYGMATSHAQHAIKEMSDILRKNGISVKYAIHPVAGRMPGHMNVLLAEADVSHEDVFELDEINRDFASCDVVYAVGANDITNPAAKNDPSSSIYGMPILDVARAKVVIFLKRSMGVGYAGIDNELFYAQNTIMLLGDAKKTTEDVVRALS
ncbi:MAG: NAD(P)(+) transhydrogenase (Re/Si-specific) subunit beta [Holosporaceae bacterium]|jgi:NAD(P) transhydrogenase subunit beta|nr:NAD(P)(+) transhydrogenase (Re/Si-specific) subunit beta [Holosporaceae bacterium]